MIPLGVVSAYFTLWFLVASKKNRTDYVDVAWGGGFLAILATSWLLTRDEGVQTANLIIVACVALWAARIIYHLGKRNFTKKEDDPRYLKIKSKWSDNIALQTYIKIFLFQGLLVWLISLPVIASWDVQVGDDLTGIYIGLVVWGIGFLFESIGDRQLRVFISDPKNKGKIMTGGLWRYSRHPNYFGEVTQWWGIWLMSLYLNPVWWSVIGPLTITYLIVFLSGIPLQERRYAANNAYQRYKKRTSALIPSIPKS